MPPLRLLWSRLQPWVPLIAMLACLPALANGIELDDLFHAAAARAQSPAEFLGSAFTFFGDGPRTPHVATHDLPWWTEPGLQLDLLRPVAGFTHWLDYTLWPGQPWLMHLHSVLWYGLLVLLVQRLYLALTGDRSRAALAALIFGISQAHAMNVGWLAARNALIAAVFVTAAIAVHHRWRAQAWTPGAVLGPLLLGVALLANEGAVAALGYLLGYAIVLDRGRRRWLSLLPYVGVAIAWRAAYELLGYGAAHTGIYLDPGSDPVSYAARTIIQAVPILAARLGLAVLDPLNSIPGAEWVAFVLAIPFLVGVAWLARTRLRVDPVTRMWGLGLVLSSFTAGTTVATDRGLLLLGLGGCALLADLITWLRREDAGRLDRVLAGGLIALHLVISPVLMPLRVGSTAWVHGLVEKIAASIPSGPTTTDKTIVLVNAPSDLVMFYSRAIAEQRGVAFPKRVHWLHAGPATLTLTRTADDVIELAADQPWLATPLDRMFRADLEFALDQRFESACFTAQILAIERSAAHVALPTAVRFELHDERPGCELVIMAWTPEGFAPYELPKVGASQQLEPAQLL